MGNRRYLIIAVGVIGAHIFYRWPGAAGRPGAFTASYAGAEPTLASARVNSPQAPDPAIAPILERGAAAIPTSTQQAAAPSANRREQVEERSTIMPQSGDVRAEFANSGRWITRP